jgi:hypothetical protein
LAEAGRLDTDRQPFDRTHRIDTPVGAPFFQKWVLTHCQNLVNMVGVSALLLPLVH